VGRGGQLPDADQKWLLTRAVDNQTVVFTRCFLARRRAVNADEKSFDRGVQRQPKEHPIGIPCSLEAKFPILLKKFPV
jgi:hypothetical protein